MPPSRGHQRFAIESVEGLGERQLGVTRRRDYGRIVGVHREGDAQVGEFSKIGFETDARVARWAYAKAHTAIDQQSQHFAIRCGPDAMSDAGCPEHFHGLANDIRTANLSCMRHEAKPGGARAVNEAGAGRCGDRLVAHQPDANDPFSGEGHVGGSGSPFWAGIVSAVSGLIVPWRCRWSSASCWFVGGVSIMRNNMAGAASGWALGRPNR